MSRNPDSDDTQRTGRLMLILAWVGGLAMLTLLFQDVLESQLNPNTAPLTNQATDGRQEVVLERNRKGHYVASGAINQSPVTFLLDTGATDIALPEGLADRLGLERRGGAVSQTANGPVAVWRTRIDQVSLGGITLRDVSASILPSMQPDDPVLLGMSFLRQVDFEQRDNTLTLRY